MLTDAQIDRYSRQIILPELGGAGQERLLAAKLTVLAETEDLVPALNYLAGAGIGAISLCAIRDGHAAARIAAEMTELNPDVRIDATADELCGEALLVLAATSRVIEIARRINQGAAYRRAIFARIGEPCLLAVLTARPPCIACAHRGLLGPIERDRPVSMPIAIAAAAEAIRMLAAVVPQPARLIEFWGYESRLLPLNASVAPRCPVCGR
jgi:hypothetical protein